MNRIYFLRTTRLGFSKWKLKDIDLALSLWGDNLVTKFISSGGMNEDMVQKRLDFEITHDTDYSVQYWPLFLLETNEFIGCCGLRAYDSTPGDLGENVYELGFHLKREYWGKGYAMEAARAVIEYGFDILKLKAIFAGHHPENIASGKVLSKLGFVSSGYHFYPPTGLDHPCYLLQHKPGV